MKKYPSCNVHVGTFCSKHQVTHLAINRKGLIINRQFTKEGVDVFDQFEYELRTSSIKNTDGSSVFELKNVEVPKGWSQVATDILAQKYFRKEGVPQFAVDGTYLKDAKGNEILGSEHSVKEVVWRLASTWTRWGLRNGYFASEEDAERYTDEMIYILLSQMGAPNSPQWFNTGLSYVYGIKGKAQGHYYVDEKTGKLTESEDAYTRPQPHACFIQSVEDDLVNEGGIFDLATKEARVFKYGSGTGTNFSKLRGSNEKLSGGGKSSGLMGWLRIYDRAAGAIKSGGTTRRAAKMVIVDIDHPDIEEFINWKMKEEQKVAALVAGSKINETWINLIMKLAHDLKTFDVNDSIFKSSVQEATRLGVPYNYIVKALSLAKQGHTSMKLPVFDTHYESDAYNTVSGQNSNNSVSLSNAFLKAVEDDADWNLTNRTDGKVAKTLKARELWQQIALAAWASADPGIHFNDTMNEWHTCPKDGKIRGTNPCSEYVFLDDTACNLASINLTKFLKEDGTFDVEAYRHAIHLWTLTLEISVLMAQFPSKVIAQKSYDYRTLGLGFANLGTLLMRWGIPYDSEEGRAICGALSAILTGQAYSTSAQMAKAVGAFPRYETNKEAMLRVIRNHQRAAYNRPKEEYEGLTVAPVGIKEKYCPFVLLSNAKDAWNDAMTLGSKYGFRNAQVTVIAPTGTIGLLMDCDTTGVEPDFALVKMKKLAGGGYFKIVNQSIVPALQKLDYSPSQIKDIEDYAKGRGTLTGCPFINVAALKAMGFYGDQVMNVEEKLATAFDVKFVFNKWNLGESFCKNVLGFSEEQLSNPKFNMLKALGFKKAEIETANEYICGTMTLEGAPHLRPSDYPVFDCANRCGKKGTRFIPYQAHIEMMGACQSFISGAISKTINMPNEATIEQVKDVYAKSFKLGVKALALYRDGSKLSQPLNTLTEEEEEQQKEEKKSFQEGMVGFETLLKDIPYVKDLVVAVNDAPTQIEVPVALEKQAEEFKGRARLPPRRSGFTQESKIGGQKFYLRTGEYPDGRVGEIFLDAYKQGAGYKALLNSFAILASKALQYGVPLEELVDTFTFTRFEPNGIVQGDSVIKTATSPLDYAFRVLGNHYLGRKDLVHIKDTPEKH